MRGGWDNYNVFVYLLHMVKRWEPRAEALEGDGKHKTSSGSVIQDNKWHVYARPGHIWLPACILYLHSNEVCRVTGGGGGRGFNRSGAVTTLVQPQLCVGTWLQSDSLCSEQPGDLRLSHRCQGVTHGSAGTFLLQQMTSRDKWTFTVKLQRGRISRSQTHGRGHLVIMTVNTPGHDEEAWQTVWH